MARNKHTSLAAVVGFATQAVLIFFPEWKAKCDELFKLCIIYGFALAGDAGPPKSSNGSPSRLPIVLALLCALAVTSCAVVRQSATTTTTGTNGVVTVTSARSSIIAAGDAKTIVDKARASAGKTSTVGVQGVDESTASPVSATNLSAAADLLRAAQGR